MRRSGLCAILVLCLSVQAAAFPPCTQIDGDPDCYTVLGVKPAAKLKDIKKAYRTKARDVHPDKVKRDQQLEDANAAFVALAAAYEILSDEQTRRDYDRGVGRFGVVKSRDGTEETISRSATWARSQYDAAADPILTVKGWIVISLIGGSIYGLSTASEKARLATRAFLKSGKQKNSMRKGMEEGSRRATAAVSAKSEAHVRKALQRREHFQRELKKAREEAVAATAKLLADLETAPGLLRCKDEKDLLAIGLRAAACAREGAAATRAANDAARDVSDPLDAARGVEGALCGVLAGLLREARGRWEGFAVGDDPRRQQLITWGKDAEELRRSAESVAKQGPPEDDDDLNDTLSLRANLLMSQARQLRAFGVQFTSLAKDPKPVIEEGTELGGVAKARPWAQEEAARLRLALQKYPKGTPKRWTVVAEFVGGGRTEEEIRKKIALLLKAAKAKREAAAAAAGEAAAAGGGTAVIAAGGAKGSPAAGAAAGDEDGDAGDDVGEDDADGGADDGAVDE